MSGAVRRTLLIGGMVAIPAVLLVTMPYEPAPRDAVPAKLQAASMETVAISQPEAADDAPKSEAIEVQLVIHGVSSHQGMLRLAVFDRGDDFPEHAQAMQRCSVSPEDCARPVSLTLPTTGDYAIAVYHDIDANHELNRATLGYPTEPYGFSAGARSTFGPPQFAAAVVSIEESGETLDVSIR